MLLLGGVLFAFIRWILLRSKKPDVDVSDTNTRIHDQEAKAREGAHRAAARADARVDREFP